MQDNQDKEPSMDEEQNRSKYKKNFAEDMVDIRHLCLLYVVYVAASTTVRSLVQRRPRPGLGGSAPPPPKWMCGDSIFFLES